MHLPSDPSFPPSLPQGSGSKRNLLQSHISHTTPRMALPKEQDLPPRGITWSRSQLIPTFYRGKSRVRDLPPGTCWTHNRTHSSGVLSLPEFALLSLNFLWNSDLAASKLSKEETLRRLWKLPPGRDRKKPHAEYDPRGPTKGSSCFGDECCRVGSASRLGLRSFSRRDSVSDCTQFSLGDVFKSLKIRESPPGFKTAGRKRFIRRGPHVLGGEGEGAGGGKRRGRGLGSAAVPEVASNWDQDLQWGNQNPRALAAPISYQRLGDALRGDAAQLGSRPEREEKRRP